MNTPRQARKGATRRRHSAAFKRKLLELSQQRGASVAAIALEHGVNANLLFKWRRQEAASSGKAPTNSPVLLPVTLQAAQALSSGTGAPRAAASPGVIEVELGQVRLRLRGCVDEASLRCLVRALREAA
jgi:transposase